MSESSTELRDAGMLGIVLSSRIENLGRFDRMDE